MQGCDNIPLNACFFSSFRKKGKEEGGIGEGGVFRARLQPLLLKLDGSEHRDHSLMCFCCHST